MGAVCVRCQKTGHSEKDVFDPDFSKRDAVIVTLTWRQIMSDYEYKIIAKDLFATIFEVHPHLMLPFKARRPDTPTDKKEFYMKIHSLTVLHRISTFVDFAEKPPILVSLMKKVARSHLAKGITTQDMENFCEACTAFALSRIGEVYLQKDVTEAWKRFFDKMVNIFKLIQDESSMLGLCIDNVL